MKKRATTPTRTNTVKNDHAHAPDALVTKDRNRIAMKAYELYEQRGCLDGHALEDWLKAETIIKGPAE